MARQPDPTISAVLIVKDEEDYLARSLESVRWVDEIVVYDTGSTDRTVEIARQFTDTVVEGFWNDNFGEARNRALEHATSDWVLIIDADETFECEPRSVRRHLAAGDVNFLSVNVAARVAAPGPVDPPVVTVRLFRRADGQYVGALHEQVVPRSGVRGAMRPLPGAMIRHSGYSEGPEAMAARVRRNLEIAERELAAVEADGSADGAALARRRANLARTLSASGRRDEALELAEQVYLDGTLSDVGMELFANSMAMTAAASGDFALAREWVSRLKAVVGNAVWAHAALVHVTSLQERPEATLDALECIPTTVVDHRGRQVRRVDFATYEIWALHRLGRIADARAAAVRAAEAGVLPGRPLELWAWIGEEGVRRVSAALSEETWRLLAVLCTHVGDAGPARRVLDIMAEVRPGDLATLLSARKLRFPQDLPGLEEAATWAARMRAVGLEEDCPLVAIAVDGRVSAPQRARAAALAHSAYGDVRALPALESALADVEPEDEAELGAHLDVLAPGLVQRA